MLLACVGASAADGAGKPAVAAPAGVATGPVERVWTSLQGEAIRADFVELRGGDVYLKRGDGSTVRVRIGALAPADQAMARELDARQKRGPEAQERGREPNLLPVFLEGPGKGNHAVYTHPKFVATVGPSGQVTIVCRDGATNAGKAILLGAGYGYSDRVKGYVGRRIVRFDTWPRPTLQPEVLTFTGTLDDEVAFTVNYAFKDNTVQAWAWVDDPPGLAGPTRMGLRFTFTASHTFADDVAPAERQRVLGRLAVAIDPLEGTTVRFPYGKSTERLEAPARRVAIEGPVYGSRKLVVTPLSLKDGPLGPWIYPGTAPYRGYSVGLQKSDDASRSDRCRIVLTID